MKNVTYDTSEYNKLQQAFEFFNQKLFKNKLPMVFFTLPRHRGADGYFKPDGFKQRQFDKEGKQLPPGYTIHEIAIMPDAMHQQPDRDVLSTLVHEMCHLQQQEQGKPSRSGYHNREFAKMMQAAGLQASTRGKFDKRNQFRTPESSEQLCEGADTGQRMSHYIVQGGAFDIACQELITSGFSFTLDAVPSMSNRGKKSKFKFTCPFCKVNAWAKDGVKLCCGVCKQDMVQEQDNNSDRED